MKKLLTFSLILYLMYNGQLFAQEKHSSRQSKIVVRIPVRPHVKVFKPVHLKEGFVLVDGHYRWNKRKHSYLWVTRRVVKKKRGKTWYNGHWKTSRRGWVYVPGFWA